MAKICFAHENNLIQRLKEGDDGAFEQLFMMYRNKLFSFCFHFTKSEDQAEEIVDDVLLKIWEEREKINCTYSFSAFLYTIARNRCLNYLRKKASESNLKMQLHSKSRISHNETEEEIIYEDLTLHANRIIHKLPPQRKLIFKLSREKYMTHEEIAEHLGISKHTVRNQLIEALKEIKLQLQLIPNLIFPLFLYLIKNIL